ncbi:zinc-binding metallopeptidase family protein [Hoeflea olei]|uniref:Zinc-ribbon domain-containing protein n=1 Tax=Hoeflea olei TaxID=1480615 RepID=A0A1C1YQK2_9HYPH|nr:putative zinc-binding metallopeptidase [Hoeflea olei]OCW55793.1 hypothetical protein AWJ14_15035 [Hoeflea olei]
MRRFSCPTCANEVHFRNSHCITCGSELGYLSESDRIMAAPSGSGRWEDEGAVWHACANRQAIGCNWLVEGGRLGAAEADVPLAGSLCLSCRHTLVIPDLSRPENAERWAMLEEAKRRLFYSLVKFRLDVGDLQAGPDTALRFEFKADELSADGSKRRVLTGHENGLITINVAEADDPTREKHRKAMGEPYRTLIGHFRHEIGHYYWDRLVADGPALAECRRLFGDERADYADALARHYDEGAPPQWQATHVSAYACAHPWEDFAETWAHYFHIVDGLETAGWYGLEGLGQGVDPMDRAAPGWAEAGPYGADEFTPLAKAWVPLTVAMNAMNRSIGLSDFYPFVLSDVILGKLAFIHRLIHAPR